MPLLEIDNLHTGYGTLPVLQGLFLAIEEG